jgi:predicted RND superfamily exporter protein
MVPIEVVVRFATFGDLTASKLLQKLEHIKDTLQSDPDVRATTNCTDFMPPLTNAQQSISALQYLSAVEPAIRNAGYMQSDSDGTCLRFTAHTSAVGDQNYGAILSRIQNSMKSATITEDASRIKAIEISGLMPLVHEIQRQLLYDLFSSFLTAFLLIAIVMTIVQAGFISGLITMIPNVFPSLALFGILGWLNVPVDIGSVMTASIAMGIAVDDTLHFLNYYRRSLDSGCSQEDAILQSYKHCGKAMIQTTLVCGAGLAVFALSDFLPTARFAWMMLALLGSALVGDLVLLPALLLNPLGRMLERRNQVT